MPILTLPAVEQTGLRQLGAGLLAGTSALAERGRRREDEDRRREQLLGDVENERGYQEGVRQKQRGEKLGDEEERRKRGQAYIDQLAKEGQRISGLLADINQRRNKVETILSERYAGPSRKDIQEQAERDVRAAGREVSDENVAGAWDGAERKLNDKLLPAYAMQREAASETRALLANEASNLAQAAQDNRAMLNTAVAQFGAAPMLGEPGGATPIITPRTPAPSLGPSGGAQGLGGLEGALASTFGGAGTPPPAPGTTTPPPRPVAPPAATGSTGYQLGQAARTIGPGVGRLLSDIVETPAAMADIAQQGITGAVQGVLGQPMAVPEKGYLRRAGEAVGGFLDPYFTPDVGETEYDDIILKAYPQSPRAQQIRQMRAMRATKRVQQLSQPVTSASEFTPPAARVPMLLDPSTSFMP